jgi:hypothetical protein
MAMLEEFPTFYGGLEAPNAPSPFELSGIFGGRLRQFRN